VVLALSGSDWPLAGMRPLTGGLELLIEQDLEPVALRGDRVNCVPVSRAQQAVATLALRAEAVELDPVDGPSAYADDERTRRMIELVLGCRGGARPGPAFAAANRRATRRAVHMADAFLLEAGRDGASLDVAITRVAAAAAGLAPLLILAPDVAYLEEAEDPGRSNARDSLRVTTRAWRSLWSRRLPVLGRAQYPAEVTDRVADLALTLVAGTPAGSTGQHMLARSLALLVKEFLHHGPRV
jgi:hypothetical protein